MNLTPWYFAAVAPIAVAGFTGAFFARFALTEVVAISLAMTSF